MNLTGHTTSRWIVLSIDLCLSFFSVIMAYLLRFDFHIPTHEIAALRFVLPFMMVVRILSFVVGRSHVMVVRYTSTRDLQRIFTIVTAGSILFVIGNGVSYFIVNKTFFIPRSILVIDYIMCMFTLVSFRLAVKVLYLELRQSRQDRSDALIFGAGESGLITKRSLERDSETGFRVKGFIDDDPRKAGMKVEGVPVWPGSKMEELLASGDIRQLVISVQRLSSERKQEIVDLCLKHHVKAFNVPPVQQWIKGELSANQIRSMRIEDLLEREPISIDQTNVGNLLNGAVVLITGAAGSIGSELARQAMAFKPSRLILLDQAESPLYELELELKEAPGGQMVETVIGDVRNDSRMHRLFTALKPEIVFHAAAYKHVPVMENNPSESVLTNVLGTKVVADLAVKFGVKKFVMVSTDKAVNPTNVMGASKRIAEIYIQAYNAHSSTAFITTRFGNVLGSNGSVIPRFRKLIQERKPLPVTHPEVTRFFMTIPEAGQLVFEAAAMGQGGEIYLFDMGQPVKIEDLAKKMIRLSGLEPGRDIKIEYTQLRPGEKLYEELLANEENTIPTHHPRIMIARVKEYDFETVASAIEKLVDQFDTQDNDAIVATMKSLVPEFKSHQSIFEKLDRKTN
ncbi:MAG: polysaccharide biosynthesis protein [Flavobacteriales bacterium]|nr:polysaccharide biosynthesis protein [Flavobacteriales bacterium]